MVMVAVSIFLSVFLVSLISFVGIAALSLNKKALQGILLVLLAFGAGTLLGGALFDIIPEAMRLGGGTALQYIAVGIVLFFIIERFIHWHHHHHNEGLDHRDRVRPFAYLNLIGEGIHNFLDGTIIAASYLVSFEIGIIATIAIIFHEIPQELGDFGILVQGGIPVKKALLYNFLVALTSVIGAAVILFSSFLLPSLTVIMLSIAGGGFLYIALSNLIPELHHETSLKKTIIQVIFLILGIGLLYSLGIVFPE